jgi:hypothetical protein
MSYCPRRPCSSRGRLRRRSRWRSRFGVPRPRLVTAGSGGPETDHRAPRPGREERSLYGLPEEMPGTEARCRSRKSPRWSAEERASLPMGRAAPPKRGVAPGWRDGIGAHRRSTPPRSGRKKGQSPGANASRQRHRLFDIVKRQGQVGVARPSLPQGIPRSGNGREHLVKDGGHARN